MGQDSTKLDMTESYLWGGGGKGMVVAARWMPMHDAFMKSQSHQVVSFNSMGILLTPRLMMKVSWAS